LALVWLNWGSVARAEQPVLRIGGTGATLGAIQLLAGAFEKTGSGLHVHVWSSLGSTGGIRAVNAKAIDIGVTARLLTDAERANGSVALEFARVPLVFAVLGTVGVTGITKAQLIDIYAGRMSQWPDGNSIRLILRPATDINTITLKELSPQMRDAVTAAEKRQGMLLALTEQQAIESLLKIPNSIGPATLSEILISEFQLKPLRLDGVEPSATTVADGSYPLFLRLSLVTLGKPSAIAQRFIAFMQSEPGRRILIETGHALPGQAGIH
jgi:phosphate transport system substrate-binding protein